MLALRAPGAIEKRMSQGGLHPDTRSLDFFGSRSHDAPVELRPLADASPAGIERLALLELIDQRRDPRDGSGEQGREERDEGQILEERVRRYLIVLETSNT